MTIRETKRLLGRQKGHYGDKKAIRKTKGPIGELFVFLMAFLSS